VTKGHHRADIQKSGTSLDGVEATEYGIQQFSVFWILLKGNELLISTISRLSRRKS